MTDRNDGGPAFPVPVAITPAGDVYPAYGGRTLRDYFAGQAAAAVIGGLVAAGRSTGPDDAKGIASAAYLLGDAMLAERNK